MFENSDARAMANHKAREAAMLLLIESVCLSDYEQLCMT
jgi:hypothetical protein